MYIPADVHTPECSVCMIYLNFVCILQEWVEYIFLAVFRYVVLVKYTCT